MWTLDTLRNLNGRSMRIKEKLKVRRFKKNCEKQVRKDLFTWVHRYLRLHRELLIDSVYQNIYDYYRNTLIAYLKNDIDNNMFDDVELGELVDVFADIFNKDSAEIVNKYKLLVQELYNSWKENPHIINNNTRY